MKLSMYTCSRLKASTKKGAKSLRRNLGDKSGEFTRLAQSSRNQSLSEKVAWNIPRDNTMNLEATQ
jgi:hypothetical protein